LEPLFIRDCLHVFMKKNQIATLKVKFQGHVTPYNIVLLLLLLYIHIYIPPPNIPWCNSPSGVGPPHYLWSHSGTPHSVELLWTSDQPDADTSTWKHTTLTRDRHPCPQTHNPSKRAAADPRRRPCSHWDDECSSCIISV
jgi:hypothetical protein